MGARRARGNRGGSSHPVAGPNCDPGGHAAPVKDPDAGEDTHGGAGDADPHVYGETNETNRHTHGGAGNTDPHDHGDASGDGPTFAHSNARGGTDPRRV